MDFQPPPADNSRLPDAAISPHSLFAVNEFWKRVCGLSRIVLAVSVALVALTGGRGWSLSPATAHPSPARGSSVPAVMAADSEKTEFQRPAT